MTSKVDPAVRRGMDLSRLGRADHEWLTEFDRYVTSRARQMLPAGRIHPGDAHDADDLAQIGRIAAWKEDHAKGGVPGHYRIQRAKHAMIDAVKSNGRRDAVGSAYRVGTAEEMDEYRHVTYANDDQLDELVMLAYHSGEIHAAINSLPPRQREYVRLRFFKQMTRGEIETLWGYRAGGIWHQARKNLLRQLEHLR